MTEIPGAGAFANIIHDELRRLHEQKNIEEWEYHGIHVDTYRVHEKNIIIKIKAKSKWAGFFDDPLPVPKLFDFKGIWKDVDAKHRTEFEKEVIEERKIKSDDSEVLDLNWTQIVNESNRGPPDIGVCYLELSPDERKIIEKTKAHSSEEHNRTVKVDPKIDKVYNIISTINWDKKEEVPDISDLPGPEEFSYSVDDFNNLPEKIEHVDRIEYQLDKESLTFEKERTKKTYIGIENIDITGEKNEIRLGYEN